MALSASEVSYAHSLKKQGEAVQVADSNMTVTPSRDWNRLSGKVGKQTESWTLDGEQLNDVTFFGGIEPGKPLVKERSKKHDPLPKFTETTLLVEVPELLEGTYRTYKELAAFTLGASAPAKFLGRDGVRFAYEFTDRDGLTRKGEAYAVIVDKRLYMTAFDAPRLYYYDRAIAEFRALTDSARL
nr:hypothetical protein [Tsuneonella aeria]